jgi:hypothetical protein
MTVNGTSGAAAFKTKTFNPTGRGTRSGRAFKHCGNAFLFTQADTPGRAYVHAGGRFAIIQAIGTKIAFHCHFEPAFELHGTEWAGFYTIPASDAESFIDQNNTLIVSGNCLNRAGIPTGRPGTMVAVDRDKIGALFPYLYQSGADAQTVFLLAGHLAGVASHTILFSDHQ